VDVDKLERLLAMRERIEAKHAEQIFNAAMTEAQAAIEPVRADAANAQTKSKYASYPALDRVLRPIYTKHGFSPSFDTGDGAPDGYVRVLCHLFHSAGHTRTYRADIAADGKGAKGGDVMTKTHAVGAAFTYGQRYLLKLIFNVAVDGDDDGNSASGTITEAQVKELQQKIIDLDADLPKFLEFMEVEHLKDIPGRELRRAISALDNWAAKAKAARK
jgi:hypothetical protein